ncbi:MAG: hypothetical protein IKQ61_02155 [Spirochaetales bacterium]|nr:hypothetical protein [Spirochaetales bacterium]MBR6062129.1 hypothetical protein [Spirochaetales bacterium]MBR6199048.1 hypothetical protein [Spirochaetales bacterium]
MRYKILLLVISLTVISCGYIHDPFRQESEPSVPTSTTTTTPVYDF